MEEFGSLLEPNIPRLRRYARALTHEATRADDLVQDTLERALAKQHLWKPGTDIRAWLFTILHNLHVNGVRQSVREGPPIEIDHNLMPAAAAGPSAQTARLHLRDLDRALALLPEEQRQVILLVGLEGMRYAEVAAIVCVPTGTVRSRLSRGRCTLRRLMNGSTAELTAA